MENIDETYIKEDDNNSQSEDEMESARSSNSLDNDFINCRSLSIKSFHHTPTQTNNSAICKNCTIIADIIASEDYQNFTSWKSEEILIIKKDDYHELLSKFDAIKQAVQQRAQNYENTLKLKWANQKCEKRIGELTNQSQRKEKCLKKIIYKLAMKNNNNHIADNITMKERQFINYIISEWENK